MAGGRGSRGGSRPRARAQAAAAAPLPRRRPGGRLEPTRLAPSGRSLAVGLALLAAAGIAYGAARSTSAFAVEEVSVRNAPPHVAVDVQRAVAHAHGQSLLAVDLPALAAAVERLPWVLHASLDRGFPNTLAVDVVPERPVAVLRQGAASWLVAASGRVVASLERGARPALPRIWLGRGVEVEVGSRVAGATREAVRAAAPLVRAPLAARVASIRTSDEELTLVLRNGVEIRLGDASDRALKLEIVRRILPTLPPSGYLDVSVPKFPVASQSLNPQVEVEITTSTSP